MLGSKFEALMANGGKWTEGWKDGRMEGRKDGRMEGRKDGWKDGRLKIPLCVLQDIGLLGLLPKKQGGGRKTEAERDEKEEKFPPLFYRTSAL